MTAAQTVIIIMFFGAVVPLLGVLPFSTLPSFLWMNLSVHTALEIMGGSIAISVSVLLLRLHHLSPALPYRYWICIGLLPMGVLDIFHALASPGDSFVWLRSLATFLGGLGFALVWLDHRLITVSKRLSLIPMVCFFAALLGVFSLVFPEKIPAMLVDENFSPFSLIMNRIAGLLFYTAAFRFARNFFQRRQVDDLLFLFHCLLFGSAGILFETSKLWNGEWWWWHILRLSAYGVALHFIVMTYLSSEKERDQLLREIDDTQKQLQDQKFALDMSSIVAITDEQGKIVYANDKFCETSKYSREELIGQDHRILNSGFHKNDFFKNLWTTIKSGEVWNGEIKNRCKDGSSYWVDTTIVPFLDDSGKPYQYLAIRNDITEKKLGQHKIEEERAKAFQSEKLAGLGEMSAGIAHELGNPLAAIRGRMEILDGQIDSGKLEPDKLKKAVTTVISLVDRMVKIIKGMRALARDGSKDPLTNSSLQQIVQEVTDFSSEKILNSGVDLKISKISPSLNIQCRSTQIAQVILNLLNNACDAIKPLDEKWIKLSIKDLGQDVEIRLTDSGEGIPEKVRDQILIPFFTTKPKGKGTGLGLSISYDIIKDHKGILMLDTDSPNTSFVIRLPKEAR